MSRYQGEFAFRHDQPAKLGVLLVNLGSPDEPTPAALRRYLKEFLWDPRIVEIPRPLWWLILNLVVLNVRSRKSAAAYQSIWTEKGSPLLVNSLAQQRKLAQAFEAQYPGLVEVALGMRYGNPSIESALESLHAAGARRLLVLPLYPQYSATSTGSVFDAVADLLKRRRWIPELRFINHYHDHPAYIDALAARVRQHWEQHGQPDKLVMSFHGIPKRCLLQGDPYYCECQKTARLLAEALALDEDRWMITFQSRFGREEWLKPYTAATLKKLPREGVKQVDVVCPGFSADCLETLEEIDETNRGIFLKAGGERFHYIPALNAGDEHIEFLKRLIEWHSLGWPELAASHDQDVARQQAKAALERARAQGAET